MSEARKPLIDYINPFVLYNPQTPAGRLEFLWGMVYPIVLTFVILIPCAFVEAFLGYINQAPITDPLLSILTLATFPAAIIVNIRRLRDMGKSGWTVLVAFIPLVGLVYLLWVLFSESALENAPQVTDNKPEVSLYGQDQFQSIASYISHAKSLAEQGRLNESERQLEIALEIEPNANEVIAGYPRQTQLAQSYPVSGYALLVQRAKDDGKPGTALRYLGRMLDLTPVDPGHARQAARSANLNKEAKQLFDQKGVSFGLSEY